MPLLLSWHTCEVGSQPGVICRCQECPARSLPALEDSQPERSEMGCWRFLETSLSFQSIMTTLSLGSSTQVCFGLDPAVAPTQVRWCQPYCPATAVQTLWIVVSRAHQRAWKLQQLRCASLDAPQHGSLDSSAGDRTWNPRAAGSAFLTTGPPRKSASLRPLAGLCVLRQRFGMEGPE